MFEKFALFIKTLLFFNVNSMDAVRSFSFAYGLLVRTNRLPELGMKHYIQIIDYRLRACLWILACKWIISPIPVAARSKAYVYGRSPAEIVGSNPTGGMDVCLLWVLCVVR